MHRTSLHFLDDIKEAAGKIRKYTTGMTYEEFLADEKTQDAVIRNFEVIGEATKNLPTELRNRYSAVEWRQVAGLRDVMAHGYYRIDRQIVWEIVTEKIPGFRKDILKIIREETKREEG